MKCCEKRTCIGDVDVRAQLQVVTSRGLMTGIACKSCCRIHLIDGTGAFDESGQKFYLEGGKAICRGPDSWLSLKSMP
jgi:hypothetical protein